MASWHPEQYLQFREERTRPCHDLVARIALARPARIIDLGCGPGNSTAVLRARWPEADVTGLDNSGTMLEQARASDENVQWVLGDIASWADAEGQSYDVVFSNAALQWVGDHAALLPKLAARVAAGGVLAVQVRSNWGAPAHTTMRSLAGSEKWRGRFPENGVREWFVHEPGFYYDVLAPLAVKLDLWQTTYFQVMPEVRSIAEWYRGTGMRPFLDALQDDPSKQEFFEDYSRELERHFAPRKDGRVLFPFERLFAVAAL